MENKIVGQISTYFHGLANDVFPNEFKERATVILSGSTGWGIGEGFDKIADWDLHIILSNDDYKKFVEKFGSNYVIDDHNNDPIVFGQIRSIEWLTDRMEGTKKVGTWPLYLWIYTRCKFVQDNLGIKEIVESYQKKFDVDLDNLRKEYFVLFSVRRLDTSSSAARGLLTAAKINCGEMVKAALQTFSLIKAQPFSYNKWLAKHVENLDQSGEKILELCNKCLCEKDLSELNTLAKSLRDLMEIEMGQVVGEQRWIKFWWEFNEN